MSLLSVSTCSQFSLTPTLPDDSECLTPTYTDILSKMSTAHTRAHEKRPFFRRPYYLPSDKDCSTAAFSAYDNRDLTLVEESSEADRLFASGDYLGSPLSKCINLWLFLCNDYLCLATISYALIYLLIGLFFPHEILIYLKLVQLLINYFSLSNC